MGFVRGLQAQLSLHYPKAFQEILSGKIVLRKSETKSEAVGLIQDKLKELNFFIGDPKGKNRGVYGTQTERAVKEFQKVVGLKPDGFIGRNTLLALLLSNPPQLPEGLKRKTGPHGAILFALKPEVTSVFSDIVAVWEKFGASTPVITSGNDGRHRVNSRHYRDLAIDIRGNNVSDKTLKAIAQELKKILGNQYYVEAEFFPNDPQKDHIHIAYKGTP